MYNKTIEDYQHLLPSQYTPLRTMNKAVIAVDRFLLEEGVVHTFPTRYEVWVFEHLTQPQFAFLSEHGFKATYKGV